jgi:hypothetical protein
LGDGSGGSAAESAAVDAEHLLAAAAGMLEDLKILAHKRDVPYQSLIKVFLAERLDKEHGGR